MSLWKKNLPRPNTWVLDCPWLASRVLDFPIVSLRYGMLSTGSSSQIIVAQTRTARVAMKLARNLAAEVPVATQLFLGLLQAPEQVCMAY